MRWFHPSPKSFHPMPQEPLTKPIFQLSPKDEAQLWARQGAESEGSCSGVNSLDLCCLIKYSMMDTFYSYTVQSDSP